MSLFAKWQRSGTTGITWMFDNPPSRMDRVRAASGTLSLRDGTWPLARPCHPPAPLAGSGGGRRPAPRRWAPGRLPSRCRRPAAPSTRCWCWPIGSCRPRQPAQLPAARPSHRPRRRSTAGEATVPTRVTGVRGATLLTASSWPAFPLHHLLGR